MMKSKQPPSLPPLLSAGGWVGGSAAAAAQAADAPPQSSARKLFMFTPRDGNQGDEFSGGSSSSRSNQPRSPPVTKREVSWVPMHQKSYRDAMLAHIGGMDAHRLRDVEADNDISHTGSLERRKERCLSVFRSLPGRLDVRPWAPAGAGGVLLLLQQLLWGSKRRA